MFDKNIYHRNRRYAAFMGAAFARRAEKGTWHNGPLSYGGWRAESSPRTILDRIVLCQPSTEHAHTLGRERVNVHASLMVSRVCMDDPPFLHASAFRGNEIRDFIRRAKSDVFENIWPVTLPLATVYLSERRCVRSRARAAGYACTFAT